MLSQVLMLPDAAQSAAVTGQPVSIEPQLILFEFVSGFMLRQEQVALLGTFLRSHAHGHSLCHQMLMGEGKTTVIAPLLTLYLASQAERLVMQV